MTDGIAVCFTKFHDVIWLGQNPYNARRHLEAHIIFLLYSFICYIAGHTLRLQWSIDLLMKK